MYIEHQPTQTALHTNGRRNQLLVSPEENTLPTTLEPVRDCEGYARWRVRVAAGERTCMGCGETAVNGLCIRCGTDDHGVKRTDAPPLGPP